MAAKPVEFHPEALAEFQAALSWYWERSRIVAACFAEELDRAIDLVADSPRRWPVGEQGTRKFTLRRFPFAVVYREHESAIQVIAVAHGHRRPGYWRGRL